MPDIAWNEKLWGQDYNWPDDGEIWSVVWGGSEAQWFGSLYPRLHRLLPARRILEIAPGYGRWTRFLVSACDEYVGVDLADACIQACRKRIAAVSYARFVRNDGLSLRELPGGGFDFVFSFDSLAHAELNVLKSYVAQVLEKLAPGGVAFIHHSNLLALLGPHGETPGLREHARARSVPAALVADLVGTGGGLVLVQEVVN